MFPSKTACKRRMGRHVLTRQRQDPPTHTLTDTETARERQRDTQVERERERERERQRERERERVCTLALSSFSNTARTVSRSAAERRRSPSSRKPSSARAWYPTPPRPAHLNRSRGVMKPCLPAKTLLTCLDENMQKSHRRSHPHKDPASTHGHHEYAQDRPKHI